MLRSEMSIVGPKVVHTLRPLWSATNIVVAARRVTGKCQTKRTNQSTITIGHDNVNECPGLGVEAVYAFDRTLNHDIQFSIRTKGQVDARIGIRVPRWGRRPNKLPCRAIIT